MFTAVFKIENGNGEISYINLANSHNGYYGYSFEFKKDDDFIDNGCL